MDKRQYKVLKKIKKKILYDFLNSSEEEKEIITYLAKKGYIIYVSSDDSAPLAKIHVCKIKQEGNSALYEWLMYRYYVKVPIIISILALMKSYGWGIDDIILLCIRVLGK